MTAISLLISIADFAGRVDISSNLDATKKLNQHILHAQDFDLRGLMGDTFYYDFLTNQSLDKYQELINGGTYIKDNVTITFDGLKVVLVYFSAARLLPSLDNHITAHGLTSKKNEFSDHVDSKTMGRLITQYENLANAYWNKIEGFLLSDKTDYPLFRGNQCGDTSGRKRAKIYGVNQSDNNNDYYERRRFSR